MTSLWTKTTSLPSFPRAKKDIHTDVLVIGGGITGILCAYMLKQGGIRCVLAESGRICQKTSGHTTAKITSQHGLIYSQMLQRLGREQAHMYLKANEDALQTYRELCAGIPCDFEEKTAFIYSLNQRKKIEKEVRSLEQLGFPAIFTDDTPLPLQVAGAVGFPRQAQFHPLKFMQGILPGLDIYENTPILHLDPDNKTAHTSYGIIHADHIISATHFPFTDRHGLYFMKLYQQRSYVLALQDAGNIKDMYMDEANGGLSFRNYENLLLLGGAGHRTGKQGGGWDQLRAFARNRYPAARVAYVWAASDCMSLDHIPYIGHYSSHASNLYVASGFNKWGMTSAMAAAKILCDMIQGKQNPYAPVFSPSRNMLHHQLFLNGWEFAASFFTPATKRCTHMGCTLKWNRQERSWDCPCHGSRFTEDGCLLETPAMKHLEE